MKRMRIKKADFEQRFYRVGGWIGNEYWCGKEDYILSRAVLPKEYKEIEGDFSISGGRITQNKDDLPNIVIMAENCWATPPQPQYALEDTELLRRSWEKGREHVPAVLFWHPSRRFVPVTYDYLPLYDGLALYQEKEDGPISGYDEDGELQLIIMPLWLNTMMSTEELLRHALEEVEYEADQSEEGA